MNISTFLLLLLTAVIANADRIVQTASGPVRGKTVASGKVEAFLGIPFAEPPVGHLRFKKPVSKSPWQDTYDATRLPPACIQAKFSDTSLLNIDPVSEDCLYLNLWVPHDGSEVKPIILFIHGGAFMMGSSSQPPYDGAALSEHGDVIVATINYRLGGLGFFTGFTDDAPGNVGMHDQVAAIRWIKDNAEFFKGDPNNIVLMGESAGAFSVSAHLLSPLSKGLYRRAILLSGSILHPAYSDNNENLLKLCHKYASSLGCTANGETIVDNPKDIIECLKNLPAEKFVEADTKMFINLEELPRDLYSLMFYPRVGDDFLPESTPDSFRKGHFKDTEIFIGVTKDEGSMLLAFLTPKLFDTLGEKNLTLLFDDTSTRHYIRNIISRKDESEDDKIIQSYMDRVDLDDEFGYVKAISDVYGDYTITCGAVFQADIQSLRSNAVYFYMFNFLSPTSNYLDWVGVPHGEDLHYVFGNFFLREYSEMEKEFARDLMDRLIHFAKTGNPNISKGVNWPRYAFEDPKYLVIDKKDSVESKPDRNRCEVWRKRFGSVIDDDLIRSLKKH